MNIRTGLATAALVIGLGASSFAMDHGRPSDGNSRNGNLRLASWRSDGDDHDRKGSEKGKKEGWQNGTLPPGQAKKESKEYRKAHKHEADWHRNEAKEREREARLNRHHSHEAIAHKQPKPLTNMSQAQKDSTFRERVAAAKRAKEEQKREAKANHK
jgi:hypothetical protein